MPNMTAADVDAPGDAPNNAATVPSCDTTISVPNSNTPPASLSFFITCTRWPASSNSQSSNFVKGTYSRKASNRSSGFWRTCSIKYLVNGIFFITAKIIGIALSNRIDFGKSIIDPFFKNLVENPAKGPNSNSFFPLIMRV